MSATSQPNVEGQATTVPPPAPSGWRDLSKLEISPAIQRSLDAYRAALPELIKNKTASQVWVAFCGDQLVTFGRTKTEAAQECFRRGLERGMFIVRSVEPEVMDDELEIPFIA